MALSHDKYGGGDRGASHRSPKPPLSRNPHGNQRPSKLSYAHLINPEPRRLAHLALYLQPLRPPLPLLLLVPFFHRLFLDFELACELQLRFVSKFVDSLYHTRSRQSDFTKRHVV